MRDGTHDRFEPPPELRRYDRIEREGSGLIAAAVGGRDALLCVSFWGPQQGVTGQTPCVLRWSEGEFRMDCATGVMDSCGAETEGATSVTVDSWSVGAASADGTVPMLLTVAVSDCDGKNARQVQGEALVEPTGVRLSPPTLERFRKAGILNE